MLQLQLRDLALFYKDKQDLADQELSNEEMTEESRKIDRDREEETEQRQRRQKEDVRTDGGIETDGGKPKRRNENMTRFSLTLVKEII